MPLYLFRCSSCDHVFEDLVSAADAEAGTAATCPECGEARTERELTTFAVKSGVSKSDEAPFCGRCGLDRPPCGA